MTDKTPAEPGSSSGAGHEPGPSRDWDEGFNAGWDSGYADGGIMAAFDLGVTIGQGNITLPGKEPARSGAAGREGEGSPARPLPSASKTPAVPDRDILWKSRVELLEAQAVQLEDAAQRAVTAWAVWCREVGLGEEQAEMEFGNVMDALFLLVGEA